MSIKNTAKNYGTIAKTLHWMTALLFLGSYVTVYYRQWFTETKTPENWNALQLHLSIGVSIGVLVLLRLIWRWINTQPEHEPGSPLAHLAAKMGALCFVCYYDPSTCNWLSGCRCCHRVLLFV